MKTTGDRAPDGLTEGSRPGGHEARPDERVAPAEPVPGECPACHRPLDASPRPEVKRPALSLLRGGRPLPRVLGPRPDRERDVFDALKAARARSVYVTGQPGTGKSSLLLRLIHDDLLSGRGAVVLDPHGSLVRAVIDACPADARIRSRIILADPSDTDFPFGLNILDTKDEAAQDRTIGFIIHLFMTLYLPDHQGPMLHQAFRNGLRLLMAVGGVLPELPMVFTDKAFLGRLLEQVNDPWVLHYFRRVWTQWSNDSKGEFVAYLTSKLSHFIEDRILRNILGQPRGLDLATSLAQHRIVLVDLSPGRIGQLNSRLLGMLVLHKLGQAMFQRSAEASQAHVYIDEFHEIVTPDFPDLLAAARKLRVGFILAHQGFEQLPPRLRDPIREQAGSFVLFRQGAGEALRDFADLFWPRFRERDLVRLPDFHAIVKTIDDDSRPLLGRLTLPPPPRLSGGSAAAIRRASRRAIARPRAAVEAALLERAGIRGASDQE